MSKNQQNEEVKLAEIEEEWSRLLRKCLEECAGGRSGLFANSPVVSVFVDWPEAERLRDIARTLRDNGSPPKSVHRFFHYSSLSRDFREEPQLARAFLDELRQEGTLP